ncbi:Hypothetical predicted protein [Paramuricea clavata]|uniref:Uncharacterized protein n=1 Tax=Paramuricea clavata TaxID=317549 RepID=A0A6S7KSN0_PARCT|nr:Hypothetical predicted protein [Paramuricea clavata]
MFNTKKRCEEEVVMLKDEMNNCINFSSQYLHQLDSWYKALKTDELSYGNRGIIAVLSSRTRLLSLFICVLKQQFNIDVTDTESANDLDEDITEEAIAKYYSMLNMESMESDNDDFGDDDDDDDIDNSED